MFPVSPLTKILIDSKTWEVKGNVWSEISFEIKLNYVKNSQPSNLLPFFFFFHCFLKFEGENVFYGRFL